jgi:hypothetical protein
LEESLLAVIFLLLLLLLDILKLLKIITAKVGVLRASHKIFSSEVGICWNDASKFSSISSSSSQLTFCCVSSSKLKLT